MLSRGAGINEFTSSVIYCDGREVHLEFFFCGLIQVMVSFPDHSLKNKYYHVILISDF